MQTDDKSNQRRSFLKSALTAAASFGLLSLVGKKAKAETNEKIKLLTPDGKVVEIDPKHIEKESNERASNSEVLNWMNKK